MERKKSYTELMKDYAMTQLQNEKLMMQIYSDMVLNELVLKRQKELLLYKIDEALDRKDKKNFMKLTSDLKVLQERFGS
ncbi:IDEAL domain-containing protein [Bacillus sp. FJAT-49736]|uniref:IDEAL domain-containing protein n=1 Tax=Bacillus sp. FJAT-49736 TaxID=2833582 RepID=UPI001BC90637|nr:IDEAL domain-containing protein [Bacillus sp. FJAT-49736]MBS4171986.1 IDEAL domain-containing protein [Bacillus sp. FJAT-49736]